MDYEKIWDMLTEESKKDPYYQQCLAAVRKQEKAYLAVQETLPAEQQTVIEDYICACEILADAMTLLAYRLNK